MEPEAVTERPPGPGNVSRYVDDQRFDERQGHRITICAPAVDGRGRDDGRPRVVALRSGEQRRECAGGDRAERVRSSTMRSSSTTASPLRTQTAHTPSRSSKIARESETNAIPVPAGAFDIVASFYRPPCRNPARPMAHARTSSPAIGGTRLITAIRRSPPWFPLCGLGSTPCRLCSWARNATRSATPRPKQTRSWKRSHRHLGRTRAARAPDAHIELHGSPSACLDVGECGRAIAVHVSSISPRERSLDTSVLARTSVRGPSASGRAARASEELARRQQCAVIMTVLLTVIGVTLIGEGCDPHWSRGVPTTTERTTHTRQSSA